MDPGLGFEEPIEDNRQFDSRLYRPAVASMGQPGPPILMDPRLKEQKLHTILTSFIRSAAGKDQPQLMQQLSQLNLSGVDKQKIRNRLGVMAVHFARDQQEEALVHQQLHQLFQQLSIDGRVEQKSGAAGQWAQEFNKQQQSERWLQDFDQFISTGGNRPPDLWMKEYKQFRAPEYTKEDFEEMEQPWKEAVADSWADEYTQMEDRLKAKIAYSRYLESLSPEEAAKELRSLGQKIASIDDPKFQNTQFADTMKKVGDGSLTVEGNDLVETIQEQGTSAQNLEGPEEWLREFGDWEGPDWDFSEFSRMGFDRDFSQRWFGATRTNREYEFEQENPFKDHPSPFQAGMHLFAKGELSDAILAFEAAVQIDGDTESWRMLGEAHAENDRDDRAILALGKSIEVKEDNLPAMLSLAVSCTNESQRETALHTLKRWIEANPKYSQLVPKQSWAQEFHRLHDEDLHSAVRDLFIGAARMCPRNPDADVQVALGLLFNISLEYDKAVDCFRTALKQRPQDYQLWNKLGATLANSNRSQEALAPYYKSLARKPTYTRARANLGISYLNLDRYQEAATQFLACLAIQPSARHIWMNLQTVFSRMNRDDLLDLSLEYDVEAFRKHFEF